MQEANSGALANSALAPGSGPGAPPGWVAAERLSSCLSHLLWSCTVLRAPPPPQQALSQHSTTNPPSLPLEL